jgi:hypothetical protein
VKEHAGFAMVLSLLLAVLLAGNACVAATPGSVTLAPGTSTVAVSGAVFIVTTDRSITLALNFASPDLLEGVVVPREAQTTSVRIVWRETGLTIFSGAVGQPTPIRYHIPVEYQAAQDSGHSEK